MPTMSKNPRGRPTKYTEALVEELCLHLRTGCTVDEACAKVDITRALFYEWCHKNPDFLDKTTRAREERADAYLERAVNEVYAAADRDVAYIANIRASILLKVAAMSNPEKYATHQRVKHEDAQPVKVIELPKEDS